MSQIPVLIAGGSTGGRIELWLAVPTAVPTDTVGELGIGLSLPLWGAGSSVRGALLRAVDVKPSQLAAIVDDAERNARPPGLRRAVGRLRRTARRRALARWAEARMVPKLLVAAQGRVVDASGDWLPSVPVLTVVPHHPEDLWRLLGGHPGAAGGPARGRALPRHRAHAGLGEGQRPPARGAAAAGRRGRLGCRGGLARRAQEARPQKSGLLLETARAMDAAYSRAGDALDWGSARLPRG